MDEARISELAKEAEALVSRLNAITNELTAGGCMVGFNTFDNQTVGWRYAQPVVVLDIFRPVMEGGKHVAL